MTLQKDLKLFRFRNVNPTEEGSQKFDYQLFRKMEFMTNRLSNNEFSMGKVTIIPGTISMDLIRSTANLDFREMEEKDVFLIPITIIN